jgi:hypothetical protein
MGFGVRPQGFAGAFHVLHHARKIGLECVQVQQ